MRRGKYGLAMLALAAMGLSACGAAGTPVKAVNSATVKTTAKDPYSGWETHGEVGLFTVKLPAGWTKTVDDKWMGSRTITYGDAEGNFISVVISPPATEFYADRRWVLDWADAARTTFRVANEEPVCAPNLEGTCMVGDGKTQIHAMQQYNSPKGTGPEFQFDFGNTTAETAAFDGLYERILTSFKIS